MKKPIKVRREKPWNKCDVCGKFIPYRDFHEEGAIRRLETPDSEFTRETYTTLCMVHARG